MIYLAASRFNPEQEEGYTMGAVMRSEERRAHSLLRKISLTAVGARVPGAPRDARLPRPAPAAAAAAASSAQWSAAAQTRLPPHSPPGLPPPHAPLPS
jgi:hypothetical protein